MKPLIGGRLKRHTGRIFLFGGLDVYVVIAGTTGSSPTCALLTWTAPVWKKIARRPTERTACHQPQHGASGDAEHSKDEQSKVALVHGYLAYPSGWVRKVFHVTKE